MSARAVTAEVRPPLLIALAVLLAALLAAALLHLLFGTRQIGVPAVVDALLAFDRDDFDHQVLLRFRLPRLLAAMVVGGALGLCGALLQALVRNPLAEPQLLGLNAGAALAVVASATLLPGGLGLDLARPWIAALGALGVFGLVMALSAFGRNGPTPLKLILCGVAVSAFASALTSAMLLLDEQALEDLRLWLSGDLAGQEYERLLLVLPTFLTGCIAAFLLAPQLGVLMLGDTVAKGLGVNVAAVRVAALFVAALLCGSAVTLAGPIGFVGLLVPLLVRRLVGPALGANLLACLIAGPILLLAADLVARTIFAPQEIATGVVTGALGAPVFVFLVARYFR